MGFRPYLAQRPDDGVVELEVRRQPRCKARHKTLETSGRWGVHVIFISRDKGW